MTQVIAKLTFEPSCYVLEVIRVHPSFSMSLDSIFTDGLDNDLPQLSQQNICDILGLGLGAGNEHNTKKPQTIGIVEALNLSYCIYKASAVQMCMTPRTIKILTHGPIVFFSLVSWHSRSSESWISAWVKVFRVIPEFSILRLTFYRKSASKC